MATPTRLSLLIAVLLCVAGGATVRAASLSDQSPLSRLGGSVLRAYEDDLADWLASLRLVLPPQSIPVERDAFLNLTLFECGNIGIANLASTYIAPASVNFTATGIALNCTAAWVFQGAKGKELHGQMFVRDTNSPANNVTAAVSLIANPKTGLAQAANLTECGLWINFTFVFTGDEAGILNKYEPKISQLLFSELDSLVCPALLNLTNGNLSRTLADLDKFLEFLLPPIVPNPEPTSPPDAADLLTSPVIGYLHHLTSESFGPVGLNMMMDFFTNKTGRMAWAKPHPTPGKTLQVVGFAVDGLHSFTQFEAFAPVSASLFNTTIAFDDLLLNISFQLELNTHFAPEPLVEHFTLTLKLSNFSLDLQTHLAVLNKKFNALSEGQYINPGCLASTMNDGDGLNFPSILMSVDVAEVAITPRAGRLEQGLDAVVDDAIRMVTDGFRDGLSGSISGVAGYVVRDLLNTMISSHIGSEAVCAPAPDMSEDLSGTKMAFIVAPCVIVAMLLILFVLNRRSRGPHHAASSYSDVVYAPLTPEKMNGLNGDAVVSEDTGDTSLVFAPEMHWLIRYAIPVLLLCNIALFAASNTSTGAAVSLVLWLGDDKIQMPPLFRFTLGNSIRDMWNAGVYPLSIFIALFSGVWTYAKLVCMLFCWLSPARILSPKRREWFLIWLDALGKWSLIDTYVLIMMLVAFRFHIGPENPPPNSTLPVGNVDIIVEPGFGFYGFLPATMMSLFLTHVILYFHRRTVKTHNHLHFDSDERDCVSTHVFQRSATQHIHVRAFGRVMVTVLLLLTLGLVAAGAAVDSFDFDFRGAAGWLLDITTTPTDGRPGSVRAYSLLSLGADMPNSTPDPHDPGIVFIQVVFFLFAFVIPVIHIVVMLVLWVYPMTPKTQNRVFVACEVLNAWSAMDVFVVAVIISLSELRQFAKFIIGDACNPIDPIFQTAEFNRILKGDDVCFDVVSTLDSGCWLLFAAWILSMVIGYAIMRLCHRALAERTRNVNERGASMAGVYSPIITSPPIRIGEMDDDEPHHGTGCIASCKRCADWVSATVMDGLLCCLPCFIEQQDSRYV